MTNQDNYDMMLEAFLNPDQVYEDFVKKGCYSVNISKKFKGKLKKLFVQNNRRFKLKSQSHQSLFAKNIYFAYLFWVDVILGVFEPNEKEFLVIQYFSQFFWDRIESFQGEDVDKSTIKITFYPRT